MNFARYLRQLTYRTPPSGCVYFNNKIVKSAPKREKKLEIAGKKNDTLFSASYDTLRARVFRNNAIPHRIDLLYRKLFLSFQ